MSNKIRLKLLYVLCIIEIHVLNNVIRIKGIEKKNQKKNKSYDS